MTVKKNVICKYLDTELPESEPVNVFTLRPFHLGFVNVTARSEQAKPIQREAQSVPLKPKSKEESRRWES